MENFPPLSISLGDLLITDPFESLMEQRIRGVDLGDPLLALVNSAEKREAVLFGENGAAEGLSAGKIVVDMSSISPVETKEFAKKINALRCSYLDAPVSGGEVGAKAGSLTIMVGGEQETFDKVNKILPVLEKL